MATPHLRVLMVGDLIGAPGRLVVQRLLRQLRRQYSVDLVIANGENSAAGRGITIATAEDMVAAGVDLITTGNHVWRHRDSSRALDGRLPIVRPLNYPQGTPGVGWRTVEIRGTRVTVVNVLGRTFMEAVDNPFHVIDQFLRVPPGDLGAIVVDFHAEATSEKRALGWYLDGRVGAVVGTHTHVPTADAQILPRGTAYVTDVGMCGPRNSVIGAAIEPVIERFLTQRPAGYAVAENGPLDLNAVLLEIDPSTRLAASIKRIDRLET